MQHRAWTPGRLPDAMLSITVIILTNGGGRLEGERDAVGGEVGGPRGRKVVKQVVHRVLRR